MDCRVRTRRRSSRASLSPLAAPVTETAHQSQSQIERIALHSKRHHSATTLGRAREQRRSRVRSRVVTSLGSVATLTHKLASMVIAPWRRAGNNSRRCRITTRQRSTRATKVQISLKVARSRQTRRTRSSMRLSCASASSRTKPVRLRPPFRCSHRSQGLATRRI